MSNWQKDGSKFFLIISGVSTHNLPAANTALLLTKTGSLNESRRHTITNHHLSDAVFCLQSTWHTDQQQWNLEYQPRRCHSPDSELRHWWQRGGSEHSVHFCTLLHSWLHTMLTSPSLSLTHQSSVAITTISIFISVIIFIINFLFIFRMEGVKAKNSVLNLSL